MPMKRLIVLFLIISAFAFGAQAQLPNGYNNVYSLEGTYDASGNPIANNFAAPSASLMVVTTNFGFVQSSAMVTMNSGFAGSTTLSFERYMGTQNGWYVYLQDMGIAGQNYLLISYDGSAMRFISAWNNGSFADYSEN